ncbi:ribonuclease III family protein [Thermosynechococcus sp. NK55a]|nr:ribonuclease III family protein [Thermosynechococcus sp. NK55a]
MLDFGELLPLQPPKIPAHQLPPAALAYFGDAVYELFIRLLFLTPPNALTPTTAKWWITCVPKAKPVTWTFFGNIAQKLNVPFSAKVAMLLPMAPSESLQKFTAKPLALKPYLGTFTSPIRNAYRKFFNSLQVTSAVKLKTRDPQQNPPVKCNHCVIGCLVASLRHPRMLHILL